MPPGNKGSSENKIVAGAHLIAIDNGLTSEKMPTIFNGYCWIMYSLIMQYNWVNVYI